MTINGAVNKTGILLALATLSAGYVWHLYFSGNSGAAMPLAMAGMIVGSILAMVIIFKKTWAGLLAPAYALAEGLLIGGVSSVFEQRYHGIVIPAVMLTLGTLCALLGAYRMGFIRASQGFVRGVVAATGGICLVYIASLVLRLFGVNMSIINDSGPFSILFSLVVVVVAALNLVIDFAVIEEGARSGAPKYMEWYAAFGLMLTLVWLYLEFLKLLAKLNRRN